MADRVAVFNEGRIAQVGTPSEVYDRPATRFVADFVGSSNVLSPEVTQSLGGPARWASLRPEAIRLADPASARAKGRVTALRYLGAGTRVALETGGQEIAALVPAGVAPPAIGAGAGLTWDASALHLMEEA